MKSIIFIQIVSAVFLSQESNGLEIARPEVKEVARYFPYVPFTDNDFTDYSEDKALVKSYSKRKASDYVNTALTWLGDLGLIQFNNPETMQYRRNYGPKPLSKKAKAAKERAKLMKKQQNDRKIEEIMKFLQDHYETTEYLYRETHRLMKLGNKKDKLMLLVNFLEQPTKIKLKRIILKCFYDKRKIDKPVIDIWKDRVPNNVVNNYVKDPFSYGFVN